MAVYLIKMLFLNESENVLFKCNVFFLALVGFCFGFSWKPMCDREKIYVLIYVTDLVLES